MREVRGTPCRLTLICGGRSFTSTSIVAENARVFHLMGPPEETRHIVCAESRGGDLARVVDSRWSGNPGIQVLLGYGRRKPGLRGHGPGESESHALERQFT